MPKWNDDFCSDCIFLQDCIGAACHGIVVKGGNYLEDLTQRDICWRFDKTVRHTEGVFHVKEIKSSWECRNEELLRIAAHVEVIPIIRLHSRFRQAYDGQEARWKSGTDAGDSQVMESAQRLKDRRYTREARD